MRRYKWHRSLTTGNWLISRWKSFDIAYGRWIYPHTGNRKRNRKRPLHMPENRPWKLNHTFVRQKNKCNLQKRHWKKQCLFISNINYCLDELDIEYEEYKYPEPTDEILKIKSYIESFDPSEKIFTKKQALDLIKKSISETNTNGG